MEKDKDKKYYKVNNRKEMTSRRRDWQDRRGIGRNIEVKEKNKLKPQQF